MIRVVIVDDYPYMRLGLRELLNTEADIEVVGECADGQEALDVVGHLRPDVVVTDLRMPRLDGAELTKRLLASELDMAVVVVTSAPHGALAARAAAAGAHAVLTKDGGAPLLVTAVRTADARAHRSTSRPARQRSDAPSGPSPDAPPHS